MKNEKRKRAVLPYEKLTFANDFLFCKIMEARPDLCREIVSLILGRRIKEVVNLRSQFAAKTTISGKGVRFDIIFEDDETAVYDVEMQTALRVNLPKRARYYQGMLDESAIEQGSDYEELPQSYIIFICTFDPFQRGRHLYTFENRCIEDLSIDLGDDARKVFLSTEGEQRDVSPTVMEFLDYLAGRAVNGELAKTLEIEVEKAKQMEEWREQYMQNNAFYMDARREGYRDGHEEGFEDGREEGREIGRKVGREEERSQLQNRVRELRRTGLGAEQILEELGLVTDN